MRKRFEVSADAAERVLTLPNPVHGEGAPSGYNFHPVR